MPDHIIVVGAGAAGLMAAVAAAEKGNQVTVFEKNEKAGKKIYITGKGRCNLTNDCDTPDFFAHVARNHRFLYSAVYGFDHDMVKDFFVKNGCPVKVERGSRVFPVSDHASDVTAALLRRLQALGARINYRSPVQRILTDPLPDAEEGNAPGGKAGGRKKGPALAVRGVRLKNGREVRADAVILCTGGLSYPSTGSEGDGLDMARDLGMAVTPTAPSLVPFETREDWCRRLQGLALKNVAVRIFPAERDAGPDAGAAAPEKSAALPGGETAPAPGPAAGPGEVTASAKGPAAGSSKTGKKKKKKPVYEGFGEMLFTHFGISGPIILTASCKCDFLAHPDGFDLWLDLKPALTQQQLEDRIAREFLAAPDRHLPGAVRPLFPARLAEAVTELSGLDTGRRAASFTDREISALAALIKNIPVRVTGTRGYNEAIVTRGGISVAEINPSTMESRRVRGLYAAGEVLDVDAETGGFNLQIAWSTGRLAGESC